MTSAPAAIAPATVVTHAPASGKVLDHVRQSSPEEIAQAVSAARAGLDHWSHTRLADRHFIYLRFVDNLRSIAEGLSRVVAAATGRPVRETLAEVTEAANYFHDAIGESSAFYGTVYPHGAESITASFLQYTVNEPLGVLAVVMDEESPVLSFARQVAPSLLAGNSVLVRPAPQISAAVARLLEVLQAVGLPESALQLVPGDAEVALTLAGHPGINGLSFHGTSEEAIAATTAARENLTRVVAFGHSNDAVIVFEDADIGLAIRETLRAGFVNAGQNRAAVKRVLVHNSVRGEFTARLQAAADTLIAGDPEEAATDIGPILSKAAAAEIGAQIAMALEHGATILLGGRIEDTIVAPTLLELPDASHPLARDEAIRGPVVSVLGFDTEAQAYDIVNSSPFGFGVGIFTSSMSRAGAASSGLDIASLVINGAGDHRGRRTPFGGVRMSGTGTESLLATPRESTEIKTILAADIYDFSTVNEDNPVGRHT